MNEAYLKQKMDYIECRLNDYLNSEEPDKIYFLHKIHRVLHEVMIYQREACASIYGIAIEDTKIAKSYIYELILNAEVKL